MKPEPAPQSAVPAVVGWLGLAGLLSWYGVVRYWALPPGFYLPLVGIVACAAPMLLWSVLVNKVHRHPSTGIRWDDPPRRWGAILDTALLKIAGLWTTWGLIALFYMTGRWYWDGSYVYAMRVLSAAFVAVVPLSVPYILWLERRLDDPRDGNWAMGHWIVSGFRKPDPPIATLLAGHGRAWAIKGFFTAFMFSTMPGNWELALNANVHTMLQNPVALGDGLVAIMFLIDVTVGTVGYLLTARVLDAHIRSANPYAQAWAAALLCYPPFALATRGGPLDYSVAGLGWARALSDHPWLSPIFAVSMVGLTAIYAWATMAFGIRFSNLTHRGIITNGPYRFTKHPAYLSKNIFWWMAGVPILTTTGRISDGLRNCAILAMISAIYYWRARTEEKHLGADPHYVAYAQWMAQHGLITHWLTRLARRLTGSRGTASRVALP